MNKHSEEVSDNAGLSDSWNVVREGPIPEGTLGDQWARMIRWKNKLDNLYAGSVREFDASAAEDVVYVFFVTCYHVADWIKNDPSLTTKDDPLAYARSSPALRICRDVANGHKHLSLNSTATASDTRLAHRAVTWEDANSGLKATPHYRFSVEWTDQGEPQSKDCKELAKECVAEWMSFLDNPENGFQTS